MKAMMITALLLVSFAFGFFLRGMTADRDVGLWKSLVSTPGS
jgi:hypothetical protein